MTEKHHAAFAPSSLSFAAAASAGSSGDARRALYSPVIPAKTGIHDNFAIDR